MRTVEAPRTLTRRDVLRLAGAGAGGLATAGVLGACSSSGAGSGNDTARTRSQKLSTFDAHRPAGTKAALPSRFAWANTNDVGIFRALADGMRSAADDTGLDYITADAEGDPQSNADDIRQFLSRGVGGMTIQPLDPAAQTPLMRQALSSGVCVIGIINNPCTIQVAARQYEVGLAQGRAAAEHIRTVLHGRATVFNTNNNTISPQLELLNRGILAGLREAGRGVRIIDQNVPPSATTPQQIYSIVSTALQRHPDIDVVLGEDGFALPAYQAFRQMHRLRPDMYFSSAGGDPAAFELVRQGGPFRASLAYAWELMGYGMARFTADWVAGRSVPRVMIAQASLIDSPRTVSSFLAAARDPRATFEDSARYRTYLPLLGNVSYAERHLFWNSDYEP